MSQFLIGGKVTERESEFHEHKICILIWKKIPKPNKLKFHKSNIFLVDIMSFPHTRMHTHLSWCLNINELLKDLVCLWHKLGWALDFFVLLAGHPKLDILITELCLEKRPEGSQSIWKEQMNQTVREEVTNTTKTLQTHDWYLNIAPISRQQLRTPSSMDVLFFQHRIA